MWGVHKITAITTKWAHRDSEITGLRADWNRDIPALIAQVNLINQEIPALKTRMDSMYQHMFPKKVAVETKSPARLTDAGKEIAEALKAEEIVAQHAKELEQLVQQNKPDTVYDLQQVCFSVVEKHLPDMLSAAQMRIAKDTALNRGIPLDMVLSVVAVLLRDKLISEQGWASESAESEDK